MKKSTLFLIILVAIFFTSTLYLLFLNFQKPNKALFETQIPTVIPPKAIDSNAAWKTYSNKSVGFTFKYPSSFSEESNNPKSNSNNNLTIQITSPLAINRVEDSGVINSQELKMEIYIEPQKQNDSLEKFFSESAENNDNNYPGQSSKTTIGGIEAIKFNWGVGAVSGTSFYLLNNNQRILIIKYPQVTSLDEQFDQILSTFKFIP